MLAATLPAAAGLMIVLPRRRRLGATVPID